MSPDLSIELRDLLIRIDERVKAIQEDILDINGQRRCAEHAQRLRILERMVWGCVAAMLGMGVRMLYGLLG